MINQVAFTETTGITKTTKTTQTGTNKRVDCWISGNHRNYGNDANAVGNQGCKTKGSPPPPQKKAVLKNMVGQLTNNYQTTKRQLQDDSQPSGRSRWRRGLPLFPMTVHLISCFLHMQQTAAIYRKRAEDCVLELGEFREKLGESALAHASESGIGLVCARFL